MAEYDLIFEEPPEPLRKPAPRLTVVRDRQARPSATPAGYVAPDSHRAHGTYVKYVVEKCRCQPCRHANRQYETRRQHAIRRPDETWAPYVPAGPARRHVKELMAAGIGLKQISRVSHVPHGALSKLIYGGPGTRPPSKRIRPETAEKLLAVKPNAHADGARVPAGPSWKLIDELLAAGYWKAWIARQIGQNGPGLQLSRKEISAGHARRIAELHAAHINQPPPKRPSKWDHQ